MKFHTFFKKDLTNEQMYYIINASKKEKETLKF